MTDEARPQETTPENTPEIGPAATATAAAPAEGAQEAGEEKKQEKLKQTVEMRDVGPCKKHVKVIIDREAIDNRLKEKFNELGKNANVAGFRPGKAPARLIQRRFRNEVTDQVKVEVLYASLEQLADETDLAPLSQPRIDPEQMELPSEGPFTYEFEVEVRPEFDLPEYKGLKLRRPVYSFAEEDVTRGQQRLLQGYGQVVPKPEGNAQIGDVLVGDAVFKDGETVLNESKEIQLRVEKRLALQDALGEHFGEQVQGANAGDKRVVELEVSSQAANPDLRGRKIQMELSIQEVKAIRLPELTEDFLREHFGITREEQLKELIRGSLDRKLEYRQRQAAREQIAHHIAAHAQWELPQDLLVRQARRALNRRVMEMRSEGIADDEINAQLRLLQQNVLQSTATSLKEHFVLQKIAEVEKIDVSEDDIEAEIDRLAESYGESPRRVRARLEKEDMLEAMAAEMIERKALDLILESATYEDVPVGEDLQMTVATTQAQAVPGELRNLEAEAAQAEQAAQEPSAPQS